MQQEDQPPSQLSRCQPLMHHTLVSLLLLLSASLLSPRGVNPRCLSHRASIPPLSLPSSMNHILCLPINETPTKGLSFASLLRDGSARSPPRPAPHSPAATMSLSNSDSPDSSRYPGVTLVPYQNFRTHWVAFLLRVPSTSEPPSDPPSQDALLLILDPGPCSTTSLCAASFMY